MVLRQSQKNCVDVVMKELNSNVLIVAPTGFGKTVIMGQICKELIDQGKNILILTHNLNLIKQTAMRLNDHLESFSMFDKVVCLNENKNAKQRAVVLSTVQTMANLLKEPYKFDFVIIDEVHRLPPKNKESLYKKTLEHFKARLIGFTATPFRLESKVKEIYGDKDCWFEKITFKYTLKEAINNKELSPYTILTNEPEIHKQELKSLTPTTTDYKITDIERVESKDVYIENCVTQCVSLLNRENQQVNEIYETKIEKNKIVIFAVSIKHAEALKERFERTKNNFDVFMLHSKVDDGKNTLKDFYGSKQAILININMAVEGLDIPSIDTIIFARPTASYSLYLQAIGRGLRFVEGKRDCLIIDLVGNYSRHGDPATPPITKKTASKIDFGRVEGESQVELREKNLSDINKEVKLMTANEIEILKSVNKIVEVDKITYSINVSKAGNPMLVFFVYCKGFNYPIREFFVYGTRYFNIMCERCGLTPRPLDLEGALSMLKSFVPSKYLKSYVDDQGFRKVIIEKLAE